MVSLALALELTATASTAAATRSAAAITRFISTSLSSSRWEPSPREPPISRRLCFGFTGGQQVSRTWCDADTPAGNTRALPSRAVAYSRDPDSVSRYHATRLWELTEPRPVGSGPLGQRLDHDPRVVAAVETAAWTKSISSVPNHGGSMLELTHFVPGKSNPVIARADPGTKAVVIRLIHRGSKRSLRSCGRLELTLTAVGCAD